MLLNALKILSTFFLEFHPNPTTDFVTIKLSDWLTTPNEVTIISEHGYEVWKQRNLKEKEFRVNLSKMPTGIYILQLKNQQQVITKKIIKL